MPDLKDLFNVWNKKASDKSIRNNDERSFTTDVGLNINKLYTPLDLEKKKYSYLKDLGFPGEYPYTRGISHNMYRDQPPLIKVYSGFGIAEDCNERYKKLINWGADEIQIAIDLPTQLGYDSDHIMSCSEVGRVGVALDSLLDMEILFNDIPLNKLKRVSMLGNSFGPIALSFFIALGEKQGLKPENYVVSLQNDIIKEYVARGTQIYPIEPSIKIACDVVEYCAKHYPHWYPLTCCVNHMNAAGAGSTIGTAFALANATCYIEHLINRGLNVDQFGRMLDMFLDERDDFFVAIANLRATRKVWARIMQEKFGAKDPRTMELKITSYAHGRETLQEPINNIVRITLASLAYVMGGVQFLYDASYDECTNTPSDETVKVAIRTLQIIFNEFGLIKTSDPLGGSYFLESLTLDIERNILDELDRIQNLGGAVAAIENGFYQRKITDGAVRRQKEFERGERISVGVNKFASRDPLPDATFCPNQKSELMQVEKLKKLKENRNQDLVKETLHYVEESAISGRNLVPPVLEAVKAYATIGEICHVLRTVFGEYKFRRDF